MKDVKVKLHIDKTVKPVAQKHRRIPFHLREKVDQELDRLLKAVVIKTVQDATDWVSPVVIVPKKDNEIRICVDMTQANKAIKRVRHIIPTVEELRYDLNGSTVFSKIDLNKDYHQLELDEESRYITTFSTHAGLARFCCLNLGTSSATKIFHEEIRKKVQNIKGVLNIHDDILISGKDQSEHDLALKQLLEMLKVNNLTLNRNKSEFSKTSVKFFGLIFSAEGVFPDPGKVAVLKDAVAPTNKSELRSFLANSKEPLRMTELPAGPWENVATYFHGPLSSGDYLLVVIDEYSRFPEVETVKSTSANASIPKFDKIFSSYGIPFNVKSDNCSPFNSSDFSNYAKFMGFHHQKITPEYPQANGLVENFNRMLEKSLSTGKVENKNWKQVLYWFLHNYRATPHLTTGKTPAELMFNNRQYRTKIPELIIRQDDKEVREEDTKRKNITKSYADRRANVRYCNIEVGDSVIVKKRRKRKGTPYYDPLPYVVTVKQGNMLTAIRGEHKITRNSAYFKKVNETDEEKKNNENENLSVASSPELHVLQEPPIQQEQQLRRSRRTITRPSRFDDYVME